jgi:hypothetical protein
MWKSQVSLCQDLTFTINAIIQQWLRFNDVIVFVPS